MKDNKSKKNFCIYFDTAFNNYFYKILLAGKQAF